MCLGFSKNNFIYPKFRVFLWNTPLDNNFLLLAIIRLEFGAKCCLKSTVNIFFNLAF